MKKRGINKIIIGAAALMACFVGGLGSVRAQVTTIQPGVSAITPNEQQIETGPILDVVPYVLADGYTINLTLIPSLIEFTGYQTPPSLGSFSTSGLNVVLLPTALPQFTVREVTTTVNVWDNQTVVLGGLIQSGPNIETQNKVPVLGDIPLVGQLFQSQTKTEVKRNLMIFVTATLIDPAGNRVHSDDELPFAQNNVPSQPSAAPGEMQMGQIKPPAGLQ
jgi:general secretion pathway protein D